jgi:putative salt-induced outer membrane protein YdiY
MKHRAILFLCALAAITAVASADQVVFKNGDKLTGKIKTMDGGKLTIATDSAGDVTVDINNVATFSTDVPLDIRTSDGKKLNSAVAASEAGQVKTADGQVIAFANIAKINPPPEKWTGSIVINASLARGNTFTDTIGLAGDAELRRNNDSINDRTTFGAAYNFGTQKDSVTGVKTTNTDNWMAEGKYDYFFNPKFYGYGNMKVEHDRIALLNYRLTPGVGVGYQWFEKPDFNLNTEAGVTYVYEDYITSGTDQHVALRLAYHVDKTLWEKLKLFHDLEYLPAFDDPGDYNLNVDAGVRADITSTFFAQLKAEWKRDSTPAAGARKNDELYTLGVGWKF